MPGHCLLVTFTLWFENIDAVLVEHFSAIDNEIIKCNFLQCPLFAFLGGLQSCKYGKMIREFANCPGGVTYFQNL